MGLGDCAALYLSTVAWTERVLSFERLKYFSASLAESLPVATAMPRHSNSLLG